MFTNVKKDGEILKRFSKFVVGALLAFCSTALSFNYSQAKLKTSILDFDDFDFDFDFGDFDDARLNDFDFDDFDLDADTDGLDLEKLFSKKNKNKSKSKSKDKFEDDDDDEYDDDNDDGNERRKNKPTVLLRCASSMRKKNSRKEEEEKEEAKFAYEIAKKLTEAKKFRVVFVQVPKSGESEIRDLAKNCEDRVRIVTKKFKTNSNKEKAKKNLKLTNRVISELKKNNKSSNIALLNICRNNKEYKGENVQLCYSNSKKRDSNSIDRSKFLCTNVVKNYNKNVSSNSSDKFKCNMIKKNTLMNSFKIACATVNLGNDIYRKNSEQLKNLQQEDFAWQVVNSIGDQNDVKLPDLKIEKKDGVVEQITLCNYDNKLQPGDVSFAVIDKENPGKVEWVEANNKSDTNEYVADFAPEHGKNSGYYVHTYVKDKNDKQKFAFTKTNFFDYKNEKHPTIKTGEDAVKFENITQFVKEIKVAYYVKDSKEPRWVDPNNIEKVNTEGYEVSNMNLDEITEIHIHGVMEQNGKVFKIAEFRKNESGNFEDFFLKKKD